MPPSCSRLRQPCREMRRSGESQALLALTGEGRGRLAAAEGARAAGGHVPGPCLRKPCTRQAVWPRYSGNRSRLFTQPAKAVATVLSSALSWPGTGAPGWESRGGHEPSRRSRASTARALRAHTPRGTGTHRGHAGERVVQSFPNRAEQLDSEHTSRGASEEAHTRTERARNDKRGAESKARARAEPGLSGGPRAQGWEGRATQTPRNSCKWKSKHTTRQHYPQFQQGMAWPNGGSVHHHPAEAVLLRWAVHTLQGVGAARDSVGDSGSRNQPRGP